MKRHNIRRFLPGLTMLCGVTAVLTSCNEKTAATDDSDLLAEIPNVAVTSFSLKNDNDVMANLDSIFFSIDLDHRVIYNADSLPMGTAVDKLVPVIKYSSYITSASISMEGGKTRTGTVDYITNPEDSIDFTGKVVLSLATSDDAMKMDFDIKVNVRKSVPDSLTWTQIASAGLPSRLPSPRNQKTVEINGKAVSLIEESDGTFTVATSDNLFDNLWSRSQLSIPFSPDVRSLTASSSAIYLLDTAGTLYTSADGRSWSSTGETWNAIIGGYLDTVIGLATSSEGLCYSQYPLRSLNASAVDPGFPVGDFSNFAVLSNKWTVDPVGFFIGGRKADGSLSDATWAFDGSGWVELSSGGIPAVKGAALIPYYAYRYLSSNRVPNQLDVWMAIGGELADGSFARTVYVSYDNCVSWSVASEEMQLPETFPAMWGCDNIVMLTEKDSNLSDAWKIRMQSGKVSPKVSFEIDGDIVSWECPYVYLIGGFSPDGTLCPTIWRGILNRLSYTPLF